MEKFFVLRNNQLLELKFNDVPSYTLLDNGKITEDEKENENDKYIEDLDLKTEFDYILYYTDSTNTKYVPVSELYNYFTFNFIDSNINNYNLYRDTNTDTLCTKTHILFSLLLKATKNDIKENFKESLQSYFNFLYNHKIEHLCKKIKRVLKKLVELELDIDYYFRNDTLEFEIKKYEYGYIFNNDYRNYIKLRNRLKQYFDEVKEKKESNNNSLDVSLLKHNV